MPGFRSLLGIGAVALAMIASSALAQPERASPVRPQPPGAQVPQGSYLRTCRGATMRGNMLSAQCTGPTGAPVFSSIDTNSCRGRDITNDRGYLRCSGNPGPIPPRPVPPRPVPPRPPQPPAGSYQQSCRGITLVGNILRAQCVNRRGAPVSSSLDINGCRGQDIYNDDGRLRCGRPGPRPPVPPPQPGVQAIVYTSVGYGGRQLAITGPIPNLASYPGLNDNIRSIRIIRGRVQACEDRLFGGRCVTLTRSYADLNAVGMGNRISSIR
jgi:hypothetical protein